MTLSLIPSDAPPARIAPLARLPVFLKLDGRRAVVAGASAAAVWKAELLAAAGAHVDLYAAESSEELPALAPLSHGTITVHRRPWTPADCAEAAIAVGDWNDDGDAAAFAAAARAAGVPVNVIDKAGFSDFAFGAIVNRSPLVIGISTDGAAPVFAQAIRARIETLIPRGFAQWAEAAARWRPRAQAFGRAFARRFWEKFAARALAHAHTPPNNADLEALLAESDGRHSHEGVVVIRAPDDPEALTLRALRALQSADVILFDRDAAAGVLDFARREARRILVDLSGRNQMPTNKQSAHGAMTVALARAGRRVVRLVGRETAQAESEIAACRAAGIAIEWIPGVMPMASNNDRSVVIARESGSRVG